MSSDINLQIDRLLHDAEHAEGGYKFASMIGHTGPAKEMKEKYLRLLKEARDLYLANSDAKWPECEWEAPNRE